MSAGRRTAELLTKQIFRSRWGAALVLALVVVAAVGLGRVFGGPGTARVDSGPTRQPSTASSPAADDPGTEPHGDDSILSPAAPPPPRTSPGGAAPEAVAYAFASAWVDHRDVRADEWYGRLLPHATEGLAERLSGVDPAGVPAQRIIGRPNVVPLSAGVVEAAVTVDSGQLRLRLVAPEGRWLVDGVDWERA